MGEKKGLGGVGEWVEGDGERGLKKYGCPRCGGSAGFEKREERRIWR